MLPVSERLPKVNPDGSRNPVVESALAGRTYRGRAFVVDRWYLTAGEVNARVFPWLEANRDRPFFLNYWQFSVHAPFDAKQALIEKHRARVDPADPQRSPTYAAMVETFDDAIGTLLDALDRCDLADTTIIVFMSDNGGLGARDRMITWRITGNSGLHFRNVIGNYVVAWEDRADMDYNDLVALEEDVLPQIGSPKSALLFR